MMAGSQASTGQSTSELSTSDTFLVWKLARVKKQDVAKRRDRAVEIQMSRNAIVPQATNGDGSVAWIGRVK
jgi:hypothetical protein